MCEQNKDKKQVHEFSFLIYPKKGNNLKTVTILWLQRHYHYACYTGFILNETLYFEVIVDAYAAVRINRYPIDPLPSVHQW